MATPSTAVDRVADDAPHRIIEADGGPDQDQVFRRPPAVEEQRAGYDELLHEARRMPLQNDRDDDHRREELQKKDGRVEEHLTRIFGFPCRGPSSAR